MTLYRNALKLAAVEPTIRRPLLKAILRTALGKRVDAQGIIDGYKEGPTRNLSMLGPLMDVNGWAKTMAAALAWTGGEYNDFDVRSVKGFFQRFRGIKVRPAREGSVAAYVTGPTDILLEMLEEARDRVAYIDESSLTDSPGRGRWVDEEDPDLPSRGLYLRLWWD
jgi:hypothetical protein